MSLASPSVRMAAPSQVVEVTLMIPPFGCGMPPPDNPSILYKDIRTVSLALLSVRMVALSRQGVGTASFGCGMQPPENSKTRYKDIGVMSLALPSVPMAASLHRGVGITRCFCGTSPHLGRN